MKEKYADILRWGDFGIDYTESTTNPNVNCFTLAVYWEDIEPIIRSLTDENKIMRDFLEELSDWSWSGDEAMREAIEVLARVQVDQ